MRLFKRQYIWSYMGALLTFVCSQQGQLLDYRANRERVC